MFEDVNLPLNYSGGLIIAKGFIRSLSVHMGFHPAWKYEEVYELVFDAGELKTESDLSSRMAAIREKAGVDAAESGKNLSGKEIDLWMKDCFQRDYKR